MSNSMTLYFCPLTCARVTMVALKQAGAAFEVKVVNLMRGEQKEPEFLQINPMGRVPALRVDERVLTENASILIYLDGAFPEAGLLPHSNDPVEVAAARSDLIWCATTVHPFVRQIRAPFHYTSGVQDAVRSKGIESMTGILSQTEARLTGRDWWFGADPSIVDVYLAWAVAGSSEAIDIGIFPAVAAHGERVMAQPAFQAMLKRESELIGEAGMVMPTPPAR